MKLSLLVVSRPRMEIESFNSASFSETAAHQQWSTEFHQWIDSHKNRHIRVFSEEAMSRDMYPDL